MVRAAYPVRKGRDYAFFSKKGDLPGLMQEGCRVVERSTWQVECWMDLLDLLTMRQCTPWNALSHYFSVAPPHSWVSLPRAVIQSARLQMAYGGPCV